ncbi:MAG: hypothetical protein ACTSU5_11860, partial [Promethearchaeota archaeon]
MLKSKVKLVGSKRLSTPERWFATFLAFATVFQLLAPGAGMVAAWSPAELCDQSKITSGRWFDFYLDEVAFYSDDYKPQGTYKLGCINQIDVGGGRWVNFEISGWKIIDASTPQEFSVKYDYDGDGTEEQMVGYRTVYSLGAMVMIYTDWEDYAMFDTPPKKVTYTQQYADILTYKDNTGFLGFLGVWDLYNHQTDATQHSAAFSVRGLSHPWIDGDSNLGEKGPFDNGVGGGVIAPWDWQSGTYSSSLSVDWRAMYTMERAVRGTLKIKSHVEPQLDYPDIIVSSQVGDSDDTPNSGKLVFKGMSMAIGGKTALPFESDGYPGDVSGPGGHPDGVVNDYDYNAIPSNQIGGYFIPTGYEDAQIHGKNGERVSPWDPNNEGLTPEQGGYKSWMWCGQGTIKQGEDLFAVGQKIDFSHEGHISDSSAQGVAESGAHAGKTSFDLGKANDAYDEYVRTNMNYDSYETGMADDVENQGFTKSETITVSGVGLDLSNIKVFNEIEGASLRPVVPNVERPTYATDKSGASEFLGDENLQFDDFLRNMQASRSENAFFTMDFKLKPRATMYWGQYPYNWIQGELDEDNGAFWAQDAGEGWLESGTGMLRVPIGYRIDNVWECRPFIQKVEMITVHEWEPDLEGEQGAWIDGPPASVIEQSSYDNLPTGQLTFELQTIDKSFDPITPILNFLKDSWRYLLIAVVVVAAAGGIAVVMKAAGGKGR